MEHENTFGRKERRMNIRACKGCIYFAKHYGNKNKKGEQTVSNYWCVAKQTMIKRFPKECERKEE